MASVIDDRAKVVRKRFKLSAATTIPHAASRRKLATITLNTGSVLTKNVNNVELVATIAVRGVTGISQLMFRIFHDGMQMLT
ncbi:hypothetical protein [Alicyclobacillus fastidiosus]|uniref:Uncharacterized protein n=1 Tax=Alicyclobacillus fastidiosus TaxID=392011 RepID=A0ABV5ALJ2_9BACL|nr:hypothetical protein [Alicyclobacillus fastidiosus]WEH11086.1 hypothetical protein PYS47_07675 [Alicyclobacillus fastidiosus]